MLYELTIEESTRLGEPKYAAYVFEAPEYTLDNLGLAVVNQVTLEWLCQRVHEASVQWGFARVDATLSRYFPARIGFPGETDNSCVSSVLSEWTAQVDKVVSR